MHACPAPHTLIVNIRELAAFIAGHVLLRRVVRGMSWVFVGACISQAFTLAGGIAVARWLGNVQFGRFGAIQSTIGAVGIFAGLGLGLTATKYVAEFREEFPERAVRIASMCIAAALIAGLLITLCLLISADFLAEKGLNDPHIASYLRLGSALVFLNAVAGVQTGILAGLEAFRDIARINICKGIASVPLLIAGVRLGGLSGAMLAVITAALISLVFGHSVIRKYGLLRYRDLIAEWSILWNFSFPGFLGGALVGPVIWLGNLVLLQTRNGYAQLGIFTAANQWKGAVMFLPAILAQATLPMLSQIYGTGNTRRFLKVLAVNMICTVSLSVLSAIAILLGRPIITLAYGRGYESVSGVMLLVMVTTVICAATSVVGQALASAAEMWAGFWLNCAWALVFLACCLAFVPAGGALGLAKAFLASYVVHGTTVLGYSWFTLRTRKGQFQDALVLTT